MTDDRTAGAVRAEREQGGHGGTAAGWGVETSSGRRAHLLAYGGKSGENSSAGAIGAGSSEADLLTARFRLK